MNFEKVNLPSWVADGAWGDDDCGQFQFLIVEIEGKFTVSWKRKDRIGDRANYVTIPDGSMAIFPSLKDAKEAAEQEDKRLKNPQ